MLLSILVIVIDIDRSIDRSIDLASSIVDDFTKRIQNHVRSILYNAQWKVLLRIVVPAGPDVDLLSYYLLRSIFSRLLRRVVLFF
jgi:hypothetical protein